MTTPAPSAPPRSTASTALWAHLLRRDATLLPSAARTTGSSQLAPIVPADKTSTSMRILLHDTQSNLEKFSERVDKLVDTVSATKREIMLVKAAFEGEREKLGEEIVRLVNRCQGQVQKTVEVNAGKIDEVKVEHAKMDARIDALAKRVDDIYSLTQNHTQILQTQTAALQSIQDQQGVILAAIVPLLPILQAIPLRIDAAAKDTAMMMMFASHTPSHVNLNGKRPGSPSTPSSSSSTTTTTDSSRKRPRVDGSPSRTARDDELGYAHRDTNEITTNTRQYKSLRRPSRPSNPVLVVPPASTSTLLQPASHGTLANEFRTPLRKPLTDLLLPRHHAPSSPMVAKQHQVAPLYSDRSEHKEPVNDIGVGAPLINLVLSGTNQRGPVDMNPMAAGPSFHVHPIPIPAPNPLMSSNPTCSSSSSSQPLVSSSQIAATDPPSSFPSPSPLTPPSSLTPPPPPPNAVITAVEQQENVPTTNHRTSPQPTAESESARRRASIKSLLHPVSSSANRNVRGGVGRTPNADKTVEMEGVLPSHQKVPSIKERPLRMEGKRFIPLDDDDDDDDDDDEFGEDGEEEFLGEMVVG